MSATTAQSVANIDALLFAIFCVVSCGSSRPGDTTNEDAVATLVAIARGEVANLEAELAPGKTMSFDGGQ